MTRARRSPGDGGFTLIELVVAVAIMGIAMVFIVAGMTTSIFGSDIHRKQATADTLARTFAEQIKATACPSTCPTSYTYAGVVPTGYSTPTASVVCGTAGASTFTATCPNVLEKVTVTASSTDARDTETLDLVKRQP